MQLNEAIETIETVVSDANIDPAITTYEIDHPPPPQLVDSLNLEHPPPSPVLPNESPGREVSWPPTPPPPSPPQPASPIPLPFINDIKSQLPLR